MDSAVVKSCHDGDTCKFKVQNNTLNVRLSGIDAPEINQPLGKESRNFLFKLLDGQKVELNCKGMSHKRQVCTVYANGADVGIEMVKNGYAYDAVQYSKGFYTPYQEQAALKKVGVWALKNQQSPYCYRAQQKNKHKKSKINQNCMKNPLYN